MSPCSKICKLDSTGVYCVGCFRTTAELASWTVMNETRQAEVVALCEVRKLAYKMDQQHGT
jgi:predicted Fe-S protein YdhL (DUF1289 family)